MIDEDALKLLGELSSLSKEERLKFWEAMFPNGIYCPYIPLQTCRVKDEETE